MRLDHPIFKGPLGVDVKIDADHPYLGQGTWLVSTPEAGKGSDWGMVSDGHELEDSPDCERISGGMNSKGARAVAIGRQANMLQWGFYGAPDHMTEPAKHAFLNAIVYMKQFDGQVPLVKKVAAGRTWLEQYVEMLEAMKPEERVVNEKNGLAGYLVPKFPAELTKDGVDPARLRAWYRDNVEFFVGGPERTIVVDEDLAAMKLSNRKPAFLDWLLEAFAKDPQNAMARKLAGRYLGGGSQDAQAATAYIKENRPFLFFTDTGGYRWMVDVNAQRAAQAKKAIAK
jgi:hypothetical protein